MEKEYRIEMDPSMLKILGPSMYKNIYFILGELIANAWDADARNVYISINNEEVILEDDGNGMSYINGDIKKYLIVGQETRKNLNESLTFKLKRKKMGRKGLGRLAALALADPVKIMTIKNNERSGFILTKNINSTGKLEAIPESEINFKFIRECGTSITMKNPIYITHKEASTIAKNISRIFPFTNENFIIHIIKDNKPPAIIKNSKETIIKELSTIITLGKEFYDYSNFVDPTFVRKIDEKKLILEVKNNDGYLVKKELIIKGWVGTYKTTSGRKADILDFQDNFISLYSNGKIGEFNILESVGRNTLTEPYVVGELHIDLFEESDLPDMATSNREGYITSDIRYQEVLKQSRILLDEIIKLRKLYVDNKNKNKEQQKMNKQKQLEQELIEKTDIYKSKIIKTITNSLQKQEISQTIQNQIIIDTKKSVEDNVKLLGFKNKVDMNKKKILISHSSKDKFYVNLIYSTLIFNNLPEEEILYTSAEDEKSRIPQDESVFDYLRDFFVNSISNAKIHVLYVTSKKMHGAWGAVAEVGAGWITKSKHDIFNISNGGYTPVKPLNIDPTWNEANLEYDTEKIIMNKLQVDDFCSRVEKIVNICGYKPNKREKNIQWLENKITII